MRKCFWRFCVTVLPTLYKKLTHSNTMTPLTGLGKKPFENIVRKGEIACTSNFSFSYNVFSSIKDRNNHFCYISFVVFKYLQFDLVQHFVMWEWVNVLLHNKTCLLPAFSHFPTMISILSKKKITWFEQYLTLYQTKFQSGPNWKHLQMTN